VHPESRFERSPGSLHHGPEGCRVAGHLNVRKVPGTLRLVLHNAGHDHEPTLINSSHLVDGLWFGEPLGKMTRSRLSLADQKELLSPTSHRLEGLPFISASAGHSHVHYLKVVTKVLRHADNPYDTMAYKYTVHSNKFEAPAHTEPVVEFRYDLSPISVVVTQARAALRPTPPATPSMAPRRTPPPARRSLTPPRAPPRRSACPGTVSSPLRARSSEGSSRSSASSRTSYTTPRRSPSRRRYDIWACASLCGSRS